MSKLHSPLNKLLDSGYDERDLQRVWRRVQRGRERRWEGFFLRHRLWMVPVATAVVAAAMLLHLPERGSTPSPLVYAGGKEVGTALIESELQQDVRFADGSSIQLAARARIDVLENHGTTFHAALRRGKGSFEVQPGGGRRWLIEAGAATVEVVGTRFTLDRSQDSLRVSVEQGTVLVRGETVPDKIVRLGAGQQLEVLTDRAGASDSPAPLVSAKCVESASGEPLVASRPAATPKAAGSASSAVASEALDGLLRQADAARLAGDRERSAQLLRQVIALAGADPRGAIASFALAQLEMKDDPRGAAELLSAALDAGVRGGFEEDSWARLVQAHAKAGDGKKAREAAQEYERRFPGGSRLSEVRRWASEQ